MPRHSNKDLTAERKELMAALGAEPGETLTAALARRDAERDAAADARLKKLEAIVAMQGEALIAAEEQQREIAVANITSPPDITIRPSPSLPGDFAHYPKPGEAARITVQLPPDGGPPMSPVTGDMTPGYVEWFLTTHGPDAAREKWKGRIHLLPVAVRGALA